MTMPASQAPLRTSQVLKAADGTILRTIGVVRMETEEVAELLITNTSLKV
jgi:hypothetical protein